MSANLGHFFRKIDRPTNNIYSSFHWLLNRTLHREQSTKWQMQYQQNQSQVSNTQNRLGLGPGP